MDDRNGERMASIAATQLEPDVPGADLVARKLRRAWKKERHYYHTRGVCYLALWAAAMVLLDFAVDFLFRLPGYGRLALLGVNVAVVG